MDKYIASKVTFPSFVSKIVIGGYGLGRSRDPLNLKSRSFNILAAILLITVKREYLAAIIFGGFSNMAIWQRFNLAISHTGNI